MTEGKKCLIHDMPSLNLSFIFLLESHTQNYYLTTLRKRMGVGRFAQRLSSSNYNIGQSVMETLSINKK